MNFQVSKNKPFNSDIYLVFWPMWINFLVLAWKSENYLDKTLMTSIGSRQFVIPVVEVRFEGLWRKLFGQNTDD